MRKSDLITTEDKKKKSCFQDSLLNHNQMVHVLGGGVNSDATTKGNDKEDSDEDDNDYDDEEQLGVPVLIPF